MILLQIKFAKRTQLSAASDILPRLTVAGGSGRREAHAFLLVTLTIGLIWLPREVVNDCTDAGVRFPGPAGCTVVGGTLTTCPVTLITRGGCGRLDADLGPPPCNRNNSYARSLSHQAT